MRAEKQMLRRFFFFHHALDPNFFPSGDRFANIGRIRNKNFFSTNDFFYLQSKAVCLYFYLNSRIEFLVELNSNANVINVEVNAGSAVERRRRHKMAAKKKATKKKATKKKATKKKAKKK